MIHLLSCKLHSHTATAQMDKEKYAVIVTLCSRGWKQVTNRKLRSVGFYITAAVKHGIRNST